MTHGSKKWPHTGAILCGGSSSRMGQPKHDLLLPDGRNMIQCVQETVGEVCSHLVVLGPEDVLPELPHVHDLREGQGPLAGIEALLASGLDTDYLIVPCDLPLLTSATLRRLLEPDENPATVFRIEGSGKFESLPLRISVSALDAVRTNLDASRRAVQRLTDEFTFGEIILSPAHAKELHNINTPEEFEALRDKLQQGTSHHHH